MRFYGYLFLVAGIIILTGYMQNPTDRNKLGFFGDFIYTLSHPNTIGDYFKEENKYEKIFAIAPKEKRIKRLDKFDNEYYLTLSYFRNDTFTAQKLLLPSDSIVKEFKISREEVYEHCYDTSWLQDGPDIFIKAHEKVERTRALHFLFQGKQVVFNASHGPLYCYNTESTQPKWFNKDFIFHHSIETDSLGNIWACGLSRKLNDLEMLDFQIVKIDPKTGKTLFHKSVVDIMHRSVELQKLNYFGNAYTHRDVHHLNDIQPFQTENGLELLISLRDQNLILRYCPERDSLISYSIGLGQKQHDVDYLKGRVYVFSNNDPSRYSGMDYNTINTQNMINLGSDYKEFYQLEWFKKHKPFTHHQGQQEVLNDSTFMVEETQPGIIYVVEGNKMRTYFYPHPENEKFLSMLGWARFERAKK